MPASIFLARLKINTHYYLDSIIRIFDLLNSLSHIPRKVTILQPHSSNTGRRSNNQD